MKYIAYLPQTSLRLWGVDQKCTEAIQAEYITKTKLDATWEKSIYELNKLILDESEIQIHDFIEKDLETELSSSDFLFDCQFINKLHHFKRLKIVGPPKILDYSSLGHRFVGAKDLWPFRHFLRAIARNYKFYKLHKPSELINWRYSWQSVNKIPLAFFWKNSFLDEEKVRNHSINFIRRNHEKLVGLPPPESQVLLVCPAEGMEIELIKSLLKVKFEEKNISKFLKLNPVCLLKQHRNDEVILPDTLEVLGERIRVLNHPMTRLLPSEIITLGYPQVFLVSAVSSGIFCADQTRIADFGILNQADEKTYGFLLARLNSYRKKQKILELFVR